MACEQEKKEYENAIDGFTSDWDDFNDADNNLDAAANDFWQAEAQTWGGMALAVMGGAGGPGALGVGWLTYSQVEAAETKFQTARDLYDREYRDLLGGFKKLQEAAKTYCRCVAPGEEEEED